MPFWKRKPTPPKEKPVAPAGGAVQRHKLQPGEERVFVNPGKRKIPAFPEAEMRAAAEAREKKWLADKKEIGAIVTKETGFLRVCKSQGKDSQDTFERLHKLVFESTDPHWLKVRQRINSIIAENMVSHQIETEQQALEMEARILSRAFSEILASQKK